MSKTYTLSIMATLLLALLAGLVLAQSANTLPPAKQAIEQQYTQERADGAQNPAPKDPGVSYPIVPETPFLTGIIDESDAPFSEEDVTIANRWQGIVNGVRTIVYAGVETIDPQQGIVIVMTMPDYPEEASGQRVLTPVQTGSVRIVAAKNGLLTLVSTVGSYVLTFDVNARAFISVVTDQTPPVISGMPAVGCTLWPVNQKLVQVATVTASDALSGLDAGSFKVTGTSNEPIDPKDPKAPDIIIASNGFGGFTIQLRADRVGSAADRIYTLTATASDFVGNSATVTAICTVPHDQRK